MTKLYLIALLAFTCVKTYSQCDNWLQITGTKSGVRIGDLDIEGNTITIEAKINRTEPYVGDVTFSGDIVSKHTNRLDDNYLLRLNDAELTTTNGYFRTPEICEADTNKTYYVAMVYNGSDLKFYRNGFLMSVIPASGDLITNDWLTTFGTTADLSNPDNTAFLGYINEVRIWSVERTQEELKEYMDTELPDPEMQTGLRAYYTFDNLTNKQGNTQWDGLLFGSASINETNPTCSSYIADSCDTVILSIKLKDFRGTLSKSSIVLSWTTYNEINTSVNVVERSYDGYSFQSIAYLPSKNTYQENKYIFTDNPSFSNAKVFYRIKFVDKDGTFNISNVLSFPLIISVSGVKISPNPTKNIVQITYVSQKDETTELRVVDIVGHVLIKQEFATIQGTNVRTMNLTKQLNPGVYYVQLFVNEKMVTTKIVIN